MDLQIIIDCVLRSERITKIDFYSVRAAVSK